MKRQVRPESGRSVSDAISQSWNIPALIELQTNEHKSTSCTERGDGGGDKFRHVSWCRVCNWYTSRGRTFTEYHPRYFAHAKQQTSTCRVANTKVGSSAKDDDLDCFCQFGSNDACRLFFIMCNTLTIDSQTQRTDTHSTPTVHCSGARPRVQTRNVDPKKAVTRRGAVETLDKRR